MQVFLLGKMLYSLKLVRFALLCLLFFRYNSQDGRLIVLLQNDEYKKEGQVHIAWLPPQFCKLYLTTIMCCKKNKSKYCFNTLNISGIFEK